ncbi:MAG: phosphodiester glycosidase family protein, partial [Oscillospiraceae bacterium]|nr:phosphodiester glycosidase family protein [Oscillospiraceae bacterium]
MKKRLLSMLLAAAVAVSLLPSVSAFSYNDIQSELGILGYEITAVAPGVSHIGLRASDAAGNQNINAVEFNPKSELTALRAGKSQGYVWSTQTVKTIANNMSDTDGDVAVAAINGDFFTFGVGVPHGVFIEDGIILSTPPQYYAAFGLTYDNEPFIVRHGTILDKVFRVNGALVDVTGINMSHGKGADSLMLFTEEYARGTKTGTETYEVRCRVNSGEVRHGDTISFTVEEIYDAVGNTTLGDGYIVLSAQGEKSIAALKQLSVGETHEMMFRFNEFWSNVKFAVGGIELLLQDGKVYSTTDKSNQPRTSIGIREDGTVVMATFDGRGAGGAAGMSYESCAHAMRALGCVDALNLDGGGSTTFVLRKPGDMEAGVVNNLSGSSARQVANALVLMNVAPKQSAPSSLVISPKNRTVLLGGKYTFSVTGAYDENYKPHTVPSDIFWETDSFVNEIASDGVLSANEPGQFTVTASSAYARGQCTVNITDRVDSVTTNVLVIEANAGETVEINASASLDGNPVEASADLFSWSAPENLGVFTAPGVLTLSETANEGEITVSYGDASSSVKVIPKTPPVTMTGFEDDNVTFIPMPIGTKVNPNFKLETSANSVHDGERSLKFYYNFLNTTGSVGSYVMVSP